ncbi:hypothetical protein HMPREF1512_2124 [Streptococcus sp. OBRC6]|nr:hypothetical protein HMPREF1512_2124 [Streptococcus sp. OBRC6]
MLFRMVPKPQGSLKRRHWCFRAVLFRMVPKQYSVCAWGIHSFRAVLFRMVPKHKRLNRFS